MKAGNFGWYELMTSDTAAAKSFYQAVMGWQMQDIAMPNMTYTILSIGEAGIGGMMKLSDALVKVKGLPPCWTGYIAVDDVDAYAERVKAAGGAVHHAPQDIPGVGRLAVVADPHGAAFILFRGEGEMPANNLTLETIGNVGWHELHAGDGAAAFDFYSQLFGWIKTEAMDMGPMGIYHLFSTDGSNQPNGGMMTKMADSPLPFWTYYFNVDGIDAAILRTTQHGGKVAMGPHQVPGGQWIVQCVDPQGAFFSMLSPQR